ncbi:uncharacterized protein LOC110460099 [Mizuhopecten yessoensis]|uniref:Uncharacterized protein n=1 Tax=Mizuhopecten yessoensis TaxID=6573 RepID=A0A210Q341_MIZYE|nr:uncharacterized protein LOC110460099 [Mizuhopecten yessoensis]OWF43132.1 hypothetical protein KP79_PYT19746 [Mizuhopecten yessoensis]
MASSGSYSEQVIDLHNKMVLEISDMIFEGCDCWDKLLGILSGSPLTPKEKGSIKSIHDLFEVLMMKQEINYGDYEKLRKKMSVIHKLAATKIKNYESKIQTQLELDEEESPKVEKSRRSENKEETGGRLRSAKGDSKGRKRRESSRTVTDVEKRKLHADMVQELSEELSMHMGDEWASFKNNMRYKLSFGGAVLEGITDMFSACKKMMAKGKIDIGKYDKLIEVVEPIDKNLVDIINEYLKKMGIEPTPKKKLMRTRSSDSS